MPHVELPGYCEVIASARLRGDQEDRVQGLTHLTSRTGEAHIALRVGQVLLYLEDRDALDALVRAVDKAAELGESIFPPVDDEFVRTEVRARRAFERDRRRKS